MIYVNRQQLPQLENELEKICNQYEIQEVDNGTYVRFQINKNCHQSSFYLHKIAKSVEIHLQPIPDHIETDKAQINFEQFVINQLQESVDQYSATVNTSWIRYSHIKPQKLVKTIDYINNNFDAYIYAK